MRPQGRRRRVGRSRMNPGEADSDAGGMRDRVEALPDQLRQAWSRYGGLDLGAQQQPIEAVIMAGMGGSAVAGDLVAHLWSSRLRGSHGDPAGRSAARLGLRQHPRHRFKLLRRHGRDPSFFCRSRGPRSPTGGGDLRRCPRQSRRGRLHRGRHPTRRQPPLGPPWATPWRPSWLFCTTTRCCRIQGRTLMGRPRQWPV